MRRLTKADKKRYDMLAATMDNMSHSGRTAMSHWGMAQASQARIGYRGPDDGGEAYARVRDQAMLGVAGHNWSIAIARGLVLA